MPTTVHRNLYVRVAAVAAVAGLAVAAAVLAGPAARLDVLLSSAIHANAGDPLLAAAFAVTVLGGTEAAITATVICAAALVALRLWHSALALAAAVALTQAVVAAVKGAVGRPRPEANASVAEAGGFSFPSGHAATSAALFGLLALVAARHLSGTARAVLTGAGVALVAAVGLSRILLGAHYATDVVAGWIAGGTVAVVCLALASRAQDLVTRRAPA